VNVKTKEQSKQWMHIHSPNKLKKFKQMSARKLMTTVLWTGKVCRWWNSCNIGLQYLHKCIAKHFLLHDNVRLHAAVRPRTLLEHFNCELLDHPPYIPDLAPSDYHMFTHTYLKKWSGSQSFNNNEELMDGVKTWLSSQVADFSDTGIQKLIPRHNKCLNSGCEYAKK
jgi:hypothetical protein